MFPLEKKAGGVHGNRVVMLEEQLEGRKICELERIRIRLDNFTSSKHVST